MNTISLYIHGAYRDASSGETFETRNPATGELLAQVQQANEADVEAALASAREGFAIWSAMTGTERSRILLRAVELLRERNDELARLEVQDTGKPLQEADLVDIHTGADVIEYYAGLASKIQGEYQDLGNGNFFYSRREPLGVCAGIGA
jgi:betaine-aldehyde dehydrogenase